MKMLALRAVALLPFLLTAGCPSQPGLPPDVRYARHFYPYVYRDTGNTAYVVAANRSEWSMEVDFIFRDAAGNEIQTVSEYLLPGSCFRMVPSQFTGSVEVLARGAYCAMASMVELRSGNGTGAALAQSARGLGDWATPWFWQTGILDEVTGTQTRCVAMSLREDTSIYVECDHLHDTACADVFEVLVPAMGHYAFRPRKKFTSNPSRTEFVTFFQGNTGPNRSGETVTAIAGALCAESSTHRALTNHAEPNNLFWLFGHQGQSQWRQLYFADVQDDGANRRDRIHLKCNTAEDGDLFVPVLFYDEDGTSTLASVSADRFFASPESWTIIAPSEVLGRPFKGSVWVESQWSVEGTIERVAPGKWRDLDDASPAGSRIDGFITWVSSKEASWHYSIALFYPVSIHPETPPEDPPAPLRGGNHLSVPPLPEDGNVLLSFYDMDGVYKGWVAAYMPPNVTRWVNIDEVAVQYIGEFEGSVRIKPNVVAVLEVEHESGLAHGSTAVWRSGEPQPRQSLYVPATCP